MCHLAGRRLLGNQDWKYAKRRKWEPGRSIVGRSFFALCIPSIPGVLGAV